MFPSHVTAFNDANGQMTYNTFNASCHAFRRGSDSASVLARAIDVLMANVVSAPKETIFAGVASIGHLVGQKSIWVVTQKGGEAGTL
jgi:hypothetical protein